MTVAKRHKRMCVSILIVVLSWSLFLPSAMAWWNEEWQYRKKIAFDTTAAGADISGNMMEYPVLVRLHSGNFDFTRAKESGEDLRFVSSDDTTLLKYHVEMFEPFDEIAYIWVKAPSLAGSSNQGSIWLYYGNETAAAGEDKKSTFDTLHQAVFHFNEIENLPQDASSYGHHASEYSGGLGMAGAIGNGATFTGSGSVLVIPESPAFSFSGGMTFSAWIKMFSPQDDAYLLYRGADQNFISIGVRDANLIVQINDGNQVYVNDPTTAIPLDSWHHLAVTITPQGRVTLYLDGAESQWMDTRVDLSSISGNVYVGSDARGENSFSGDLDELKISGTARSANWLRADFTAQGADARLCTYGLEEIGEGSTGMPVFYLATIFKNITLDGLVVIVLLLILSGCSWVVMISKGLFLFNTIKRDRNFLDQYHQVEDPIELETGSTVFNGSGIYRIYEAGCHALGTSRQKQREQDDEAAESFTVTPKAFNNFKAILEKGLVEEGKRLNAWLVVLIMSISGGPFLGLLGTVWGVMNTFAAMAEAGEANIMAIAPGVASALSTTVFGLIVAIPALFGYNYLAGKIRDITADSGIFVDQFAVKVDAVYGGQS